MPRRSKLITSDEAIPATKQHSSPCCDCPFRRKAINGWLGGGSVASWITDVKSDAMMDCHVLAGAQCAGSSIFRANICKRSRYSEVLSLPADRKNVFANTDEFAKHHERPMLPEDEDET